MAIDTTGNLSARLQAYLSTPGNAGVDTNALVNIINDFLPAGQTVSTSDGTITTGVYKAFSPNDVVLSKNEVVTTGLWTGNTGSLTAVYTSSAQIAAASGKYYYDVYNENTTGSNSEVQFSVAYANYNGGGAPSLANDDNSTLPTKATYTQYRNILLEPNDTKFTIETSTGTTDIDDFYVINVARSRYKEKVDPGNWSLTLTANANTIHLIDDSGKKLTDTVGKAGRIFNVVSGSLNLGAPSSSIESEYATNNQSYGLFYPDVGIFVLNPAALNSDGLTDLNPDTGVDGYKLNHANLVTAINAGGDFQARSTENVSSNHYFVRANNREFNFSNNPTFVTGSIGKFKHSSFEGDPKTFPTTVGLYNDANELIAVAKLSQPVQKSFDKEMLIKVKLDF